MREFLAVTKALSDANRVRVLMCLQGGELCVYQIMTLLGLAPSTVSKHMAILHQAGLVDSRKQGRWVYYRLPTTRNPLVRGAIRWARGALDTDEQALADTRAAEAIRKTDKRKLCESYSRPQTSSLTPTDKE